MPTKCSIINCGATLSPNRPNLTFHRLSQSKIKKKKWLEVIGKESLKKGLKCHYICSLHFDEESFNRTLNVIRLKDDAVPSLLIQHPSKPHHSALTGRDDNVRADSQQIIEMDPLKTLHEWSPEATDDYSNAADQHNIKLVQALKKINQLQEKVNEQRKKIKCLNEKIRRQKIQLATFTADF